MYFDNLGLSRCLHVEVKSRWGSGMDVSFWKLEVGSGDACYGVSGGGASARLTYAVRPWLPKRVNTAYSVLAHVHFDESSCTTEQRKEGSDVTE